MLVFLAYSISSAIVIAAFEGHQQLRRSRRWAERLDRLA